MKSKLSLISLIIFVYHGERTRGSLENDLEILNEIEWRRISLENADDFGKANMGSSYLPGRMAIPLIGGWEYGNQISTYDHETQSLDQDPLADGSYVNCYDSVSVDQYVYMVIQDYDNSYSSLFVRVDLDSFNPGIDYSLAVPPQRATFACLATNHVDQVYFIGGYRVNDDDTDDAVDHFMIYWVKNDSWTEGPDLPIGRSSGTCGYSNRYNKLYYYGGWDVVNGQNFQDHIFEYSFDTNEWTTDQNDEITTPSCCDTVISFRDALYRYQSDMIDDMDDEGNSPDVVYPEYIFIIGGYSVDDNALDTVEIWSPEDSSLTLLDNRLQRGRESQSCQMIVVESTDSFIYLRIICLGGFDANGNLISNAEESSLIELEWIEGESEYDWANKSLVISGVYQVWDDLHQGGGGGNGGNSDDEDDDGDDDTASSDPALVMSIVFSILGVIVACSLIALIVRYSSKKKKERMVDELARVAQQHEGIQHTNQTGTNATTGTNLGTQMVAVPNASFPRTVITGPAPGAYAVPGQTGQQPGGVVYMQTQPGTAQYVYR